MRSDLICTLLVIVSSVYSQRPHARYSENLKKVVPHHYKNDKETIDRGVDQVARGHKVEPPLPPLRPHQTVPWLRWVQEGRWAAQADKNSELHRVRARLLEEKLRPNQFAFKPIISPQLKPKINQRINARRKREVGKSEVENVRKESEIKANVRQKREVIMPRAVPELIMQPHVGAEVPLAPELYKGRVKEMEKRDKRQIIYFINRPPQLMARSPRTTPNPFIRDTHIEEYDIIRPEVGEREGMIPTVESGSSDLGSYPLVSETSDLEYESDYTISMSDPEEWHNYPLTTPSGPNPGWQLSTLADIYQKQRRTPEKTSNTVKIIQVWQGTDQTQTRVKRSPKERKRKIGAYKEKIKQRRKLKDMRRKRRIIRNSKEDKAVKEDVGDDKEIERLLERPRVLTGQAAYQIEDASREILWSNGTHHIIEDKEASVKWINETHYVICKEKDNSTDEWYNQHHVLCYNEEWENKTSEEKRNTAIGVEDEEEEVEKPVEKEADKKKSGAKKSGKKKLGKRGRKEAEKKAPKPKKKSKKSRKIMTVKNVDQAPKDPRRDPREKKIVEKSDVSSEEEEKKDKKVKKDDKKESSEIKKKKKKKKKKESKEDDDSSKKKKKAQREREDDEKDASKIEKKKKKKKKVSDEDSDDSSKKRKKKKSKAADKDSAVDKTEKKKKDKKVKDSDSNKSSEKKRKSEKENKKDKRSKTDLSSEAEGKKKKKVKKNKDESKMKDDDTKRKKRSIYRSEESKTAEVRWEKVEKSSEYDSGGWTVFGEDEDKNKVYDTSYELIETRNLTTKRY